MKMPFDCFWHQTTVARIVIGVFVSRRCKERVISVQGVISNESENCNPLPLISFATIGCDQSGLKGS